jgi:hypothetical protein
MTDIIGFEACRNELNRLLDEVATHIQAAREEGPDALDAAVLTETRKLVDFTNRSEPENLFDAAEVESIKKLDETADQARRDIFSDSAGSIIARMQDRMSELNQLAKTVKQQAANNEREARKRRLVPVRNAVDALTGTVQAFDAAKASLSDENDDEVAVKNKIASVVRALAALDKAVRDL